MGHDYPNTRLHLTFDLRVTVRFYFKLKKRFCRLSLCQTITSGLVKNDRLFSLYPDNCYLKHVQIIIVDNSDSTIQLVVPKLSFSNLSRVDPLPKQINQGSLEKKKINPTSWRLLLHSVIKTSGSLASIRIPISVLDDVCVCVCRGISG